MDGSLKYKVLKMFFFCVLDIFLLLAWFRFRFLIAFGPRTSPKMC